MTLAVIVRSREGVLFEGPAASVSALNDTGPFDILAKHENFISIIRQKIIIRSNAMREFLLNAGVIKVRGNRVEIYIGF